MNKTICVFCAANDVDEKYVDAARELGELMAKNHYDLVWGGTDHGLMKVIADAVQTHGGKIIGITMKLLKGGKRADADEMIVASDLPERKKLMSQRSSAFVLLPGGIGSLDEVSEILELKKHYVHNKAIVVLNTGGFYEGLKKQFLRMKKEGFLTRNLDEMIYFADTPQDAITYINRYKDVSPK